MHQSLYKKPSIPTILQEQKRYSIQQMSKIQQSNHKLDQLQQKMKALLERDYKRKPKLQHLEPSSQPNSDQVDRYFQSSKKRKRTIQEGNYQQENEDMLLDNNFSSEDLLKMKNSGQFSIYDGQKSKLKSDEGNTTRRQKSSSSLKIFKKNPSRQATQSLPSQRIDPKINSTQQKKSSRPTVSFDLRYQQSPKSKPQQLQTQARNYVQQSQGNSPMNPSFYSSLVPSPDVYEITQLQLMMQKSIDIKHKELQFAEDQLKQVQKQKLEEYRKNMQLEIQLQNVKKITTQNKIIGKPSKKYLQDKEIVTNLDIKSIYDQVNKQQTQLQSIQQQLMKQLKQLEDQQYKLKLQKKREKFQFGTLERGFRKVLKHQHKRMKENVNQNGQLSKGYQQSADRLLTKRYPSSKTFKSHKKHSLSQIDPKQFSNQKQQRFLPQYSMRQKPLLTKSQAKQTTHMQQNYRNNQQKVAKSTSCSTINKNKHSHAQCQSKNCETDKILYSMVHELDKLKDIVNKQIVKTRAKKGDRRIIDLRSDRMVVGSNNKNQVSTMR